MLEILGFRYAVVYRNILFLLFDGIHIWHDNFKLTVKIEFMQFRRHEFIDVLIDEVFDEVFDVL